MHKYALVLFALMSISEVYPAAGVVGWTSLFAWAVWAQVGSVKGVLR